MLLKSMNIHLINFWKFWESLPMNYMFTVFLTVMYDAEMLMLIILFIAQIYAVYDLYAMI